jgi:hypothetical protein
LKINLNLCPSYDVDEEENLKDAYSTKTTYSYSLTKSSESGFSYEVLNSSSSSLKKRKKRKKRKMTNKEHDIPGLLPFEDFDSLSPLDKIARAKAGFKPAKSTHDEYISSSSPYSNKSGAEIFSFNGKDIACK